MSNLPMKVLPVLVPEHITSPQDVITWVTSQIPIYVEEFTAMPHSQLRACVAVVTRHNQLTMSTAEQQEFMLDILEVGIPYGMWFYPGSMGEYDVYNEDYMREIEKSVKIQLEAMIYGQVQPLH
jgi:hypothetical protein